MADAVKVEGLDDVLDAISNMADAQELKIALGKACALVEGEAKKNAPKGDGHLRRSIESRVEENGGELVGIVSTPLEYAPYVEYGTGLFAEEGDGRKDVPWHYQDEKGEWHTTKGQKPQPFLRPALQDNRQNILRILKGGLKSD
jgi:HK97 gp10 family phage protein